MARPSPVDRRPFDRFTAPATRRPRRWRHRTEAGLLALVTYLGTNVAAAGAEFQIRLRNDLTTGAVATYDVTVRGVRTTQLRGESEELVFEQTGQLTLAVVEVNDTKPEPSARRAWMMELGEPRTVSLKRDGQDVVDVPDPKTLGLPPKVAQLQLSDITSSRAAASAVGGSLVQRAGLLLALDFAHWPDELVSTGASWENPSQREELSGLWTHRFDAVEGARSERLALGSFAFVGAPAGPLVGAATIERVTGTFKWLVAKRVLHASTAEVVLGYGDPGQTRRLTMRVELALKLQTRLNKAELAAAIEELTLLGNLADAVRETGGEKAAAAVRSFVDAHPRCLWLPVARELLERIEFDARTLEKLDGDHLPGVLTALVTRWQTAAMRNELEALEPVRATFRQLMNAHRAGLHQLTAAADPNVRAMAAFCVAFGDRPEDLARVSAVCADAEARVRAWAAYGLAERRDASIDFALLRTLLADPDDKVRQRACMAVQGCVRVDSPHREKYVKILLDIIAKDEAEDARLRAVDALSGLATKGDLPALIEAAYEQDIPPAQTMLETIIRRLGGTPRPYTEDD